MALIRSLRDEPIRLRRVVYTRTCLLRFPTRRFHNSDIRRLFRLCRTAYAHARHIGPARSPSAPADLIVSESYPIRF